MDDTMEGKLEGGRDGEDGYNGCLVEKKIMAALMAPC